jgi:hypothetical protein
VGTKKCAFFLEKTARALPDILLDGERRNGEKGKKKIQLSRRKHY